MQIMKSVHFYILISVNDVIWCCQIDIVIETRIIIVIRLTYIWYASGVVVRCEVINSYCSAMTSMLHQVIHVPQSLLRVSINWQADANEAGSNASANLNRMSCGCLP